MRRTTARAGSGDGPAKPPQPLFVTVTPLIGDISGSLPARGLIAQGVGVKRAAIALGVAPCTTRTHLSRFRASCCWCAVRACLRPNLTPLAFASARPRAVRSRMRRVRHRTSRYLNNRLEQDHRGIKGRCRPMLGVKSTGSARRYCRGHDELRNFLRCRSRMRQHVPAATRRWQHMRRASIALGILETA
jgi:hypothetical protein